MFRAILYIIIGLSLTSCFSRFLYTDKEITKYYSNKNYKPISHTTCFNDHPLHYVEFGDTSKPLLFLIHGAPGAWYTWMNFADIDSLRAQFHLIIVDRLGYGKSGYGRVNKNINDQICSIQSIIDRYPTKELYLAGRSYGAPIAAALASINQSSSKRLVLYSPVLSPYKEKKYWFSGLGKFFLVQWMLPKAMNVATAEKFAHVVQMKQVLPYYPQINANTIIISGKKDWVAHSSNHHITDSLINSPQKKQFILQNSGHFLTFECPNTMATLIYRPFSDLNLPEIEQGVNAELSENRKKRVK